LLHNYQTNMPNPKVSLIIAFSKDLEALGFIFDVLRRQTYKNFEVVVAEYNDSPDTTTFLAKQTDLEIIYIYLKKFTSHISEDINFDHLKFDTKIHEIT